MLHLVTILINMSVLVYPYYRLGGSGIEEEANDKRQGCTARRAALKLYVIYCT